MLWIRLKNGEIWQVKPGTDIIPVCFRLNVDFQIQFISDMSGGMLTFTMSEIDRIYLN